ncbi:MAG: hypothetical protein EAZ43_12235 [Betaproteobacteria bacterium]|nr:MAG: hypothetical protein EAZ43_12235 [Betaproteobacteria bacterium]
MDWFQSLRADPGSIGALTVVKTAITVMCVAAVLWIGRQFGDRASGILAGLPVVTAPTLMWLATRDVPDFAIRAAVNVMSATAAYAFFALLYAHLCTKLRAVTCLAVALAVSLLVAALFVSIPASRMQTLIVALIVCAAIRWFMPEPMQGVRTPSVPAAAKPPLQIPIWAVAMNAGLVCGGIIYFSAYLPAHWVGMLASVPIIGATIAISAHQRLGVPQARRGLIGYVEGCGVKILFCFVFAETLRAQGLALATLYAIVACAVMVMLLNTRTFFRRANANDDRRYPSVGSPAGGYPRMANAPTPSTTSW